MEEKKDKEQESNLKLASHLARDRLCKEINEDLF